MEWESGVQSHPNCTGDGAGAGKQRWGSREVWSGTALGSWSLAQLSLQAALAPGTERAAWAHGVPCHAAWQTGSSFSHSGLGTGTKGCGPTLPPRGKLVTSLLETPPCPGTVPSDQLGSLSEMLPCSQGCGQQPTKEPPELANKQRPPPRWTQLSAGQGAHGEWWPWGAPRWQAAHTGPRGLGGELWTLPGKFRSGPRLPAVLAGGASEKFKAQRR